MDAPSTSSQGSSQSDIGDVENEPIVDADMSDTNPAMYGGGAEGDKIEQPAKKKASGPMPRNQLDDGNGVDNGAEPDPVASKRDQRKEQKMQIEAFMERPLVGNDYPKNARTPVARVFLELVELDRIQNGRHSKGQFLPDASKKCIFCHQAEDATGETELVDCHGTMSGEMKGPERIYDLNKLIREKHEKSMAQWKEETNDEKKGAPQLRLIPDGQHACRSKFHMSCIMKYNAGDFFFQYAARVECQAKFLCPLHCCYRCDVNHMKQSAYVSDLVECAICLRAFHTQCYPAGARDQYVTLDTAQGERQFEMIICPNHPEELPVKITKAPTKDEILSPKATRTVDRVEIKNHLRGCLYTECEYFKAMDNGKKIDEMPPLVHCTTCVRSFHRECCEVETIDGIPIAENQCEVCVCRDVIPIGTTVLAAWNTGFWLGKTVSWYDYPTNDRSKQKNFERSGYTVVEWSSEKTMSILPVCQMSELIENYVRTASNSVKAAWRKAFKEKDELGYRFAPLVTKLVYQPGRTSKHYGSARPKLQGLHGVCECKEKAGRGKCFDSDCVFVQEEAECIPECGKSCANRKISTGFVNKKLELRDTKLYGYGVFTKEVATTGEFFAEYSGEIIDNDEKERRLDSIKISRDFQGNNYMMLLPSGLCVDAARYGNIARYVNHSCEPNSRCTIALIYNRRDKDTLWYEPRAYLEALRPIAAGEEITFSYQMGDNENLPFCMCGTPSCLGYMTTTNKKTVNPKKKNFKVNSETLVKKEKNTREKDTRVSKKRDACRDTSGTPSKRSQNVPSSSSRTPVRPASSGTGERRSVQSRVVSTQVATPPAPSPPQAQRSSPRGRTGQVPVHQVPVQQPAPQASVQSPNAQDPVQEDAGRSPRKRARAPKVEGF